LRLSEGRPLNEIHFRTVRENMRGHMRVPVNSILSECGFRGDEQEEGAQ